MRLAMRCGSEAQGCSCTLLAALSCDRNWKKLFTLPATVSSQMQAYSRSLFNNKQRREQDSDASQVCEAYCSSVNVLPLLQILFHRPSMCMWLLSAASSISWVPAAAHAANMLLSKYELGGTPSYNCHTGLCMKMTGDEHLHTIR